MADLPREDVIENAPTRAIVRLEDVHAVMKPITGNLGYRLAMYEAFNVSELVILPFPEDTNAVRKDGNIEAVQK